MSRYSGRCDFNDHLFMGAENEEDAFEKFKGTKLYIVRPLPKKLNLDKIFKQNINIAETYYKKVKYNSIKDLIPLYPYIISFCSIDNTNSNNSVVWLSMKPFTDTEEEEILGFYLEDLIKIYNKCKRNKIEFDVDNAVNTVCFQGHNKNVITELANRVKEHGKRAKIDGIHTDTHEYYRQKLVDEMIKNEINIADYGYERFIKNN